MAGKSRSLWKLDAETGAVIWSRLVSDYTGIAGDIAHQSIDHRQHAHRRRPHTFSGNNRFYAFSIDGR